jgi:alkanesulfonate monooxygenase SsuD/methylene tetrahydromethanopterin reductase-like flavin-dependent oxidoreductase (luciferase family)
MHVGLFIEEMGPVDGPAEAFQEVFQLVDAAEAAGLDGVWLGELHFNPARSVMSAPMLVASAIATRTRRLRVGTAVHVLPLHHPLHVAEDVATLDHLSQGRFELGIGRSGSPRAYDLFGVPYAESQARFREALAIMLEAWKGLPFSYEGKYYRIEKTTVCPRPYQQPHPPLRMAVNSPETYPEAGELGRPIFVGLRATGLGELRTHVKAYRQAWQEAGHPGEGSVYLRIPVYAGPTETAAVDEPRASITHFFRRQAELVRVAVGRAGTGPAERRQRQADEMAGLSYEDILRTRVAFGTAARLIDRLTQLKDELSLSGFVVELNAGGLLPMERVLRSLRIVAHEVMPALG